jgi:hypothetical protein
MATEIFRYPRRFKAMTAFSAVVFAALAAMLLKWLEIAPLRQPELFTAIMLTLGVSLAWCVAMFKRADDEVVLDESSIVYRVPGRPTLILQWPEITRVRARDLLQRLDLTDVTGTRRIVVAYQMENFGRLRQMIREHTTPPATTASSGVSRGALVDPRSALARAPARPRGGRGLAWLETDDSIRERRRGSSRGAEERPRQGDHGRCGHGPDRDDTRPHGQARRLQGRLLGVLQRARGGVEARQRAALITNREAGPVRAARASSGGRRPAGGTAAVPSAVVAARPG